jgi:hypothetical protein
LEIRIDSTVTFTLGSAGDRKATVDAYEFSQFCAAMYDRKGVDKPGPDGTSKKVLTYDIIVPEVQAFLKEKCPELASVGYAEASMMFDASGLAWEEARKNWQPRTEASPTSLPSMDPRYAD